MKVADLHKVQRLQNCLEEALGNLRQLSKLLAKGGYVSFDNWLTLNFDDGNETEINIEVDARSSGDYLPFLSAFLTQQARKAETELLAMGIDVEDIKAELHKLWEQEDAFDKEQEEEEEEAVF